MRLVDARIGETMRVVGYASGKVEARLSQIGLYPDDRVRVLRAALFGGPLLVEVAGREIAVGRRVAARILVELA